MRLAGVICILFLVIGCASPMPGEVGLQDIFKYLERQGYEVNVGLLGIYEPGNVIQTTQDGPDGQAIRLANPIVFAWGADCFPGRSPRIAPFALPDSQGSQSNEFRIGAGILNLLIPSLNFNRRTFSDYRLDFENTQVYALAKGDLSRQFSEKCVQALAHAIEDGDKIEYYSVILEAVIADSMNFEMIWQSGSSVEVRMAQSNQILQQLGAIFNGYSKDFRPVSAQLGLAADNERKSVIRVDGPVIIGYRVRPLQPVYED